MEFVSSQLRQVSAQWRGMSVSQRIALGLLGVMFLGGLAGMIAWSGGTNWTPLLDQPLTAEQLQRAQAELAAAGVRTRVENDRILVDKDQAQPSQLIALLAQRGALPADTSLSYEALIKDTNPFIGERKAVWMETRGLEAALGGVLRQFQGVRDAKVLVQIPEGRGFGRASGPSTASVVLTMHQGELLDKQRVAAVAQFVAGAVKGLKLENVSITDGARSYRVPSPGEAVPTELLDLQRQQEEHLRLKILDQLRHIRGVVVNVQATLRSDEEQERITRHDKEPRLLKEETSSEESTDAAAGAEPSVRPNTAVGLKGGEAGSTNTREETRTQFNPDTGGSIRSIERRPGAVLRMAAAVSVPRGFLERIFKEEQSASNDPGNSVDKVAARELKKIAEQIKPLINATDETQVAVDWHYDAPESPTTTSAAADGAVGLLREHGPRAGLGLLAFLSILGVLRMAKRAQVELAGGGEGPMVAVAGGGPPIVGPQSVGGASVPGWLGGPNAVGEAKDAAGVLIGREVDEAVIRMQRMIEQIGELIKEDPAAASGMLQMWINQKE